MFGNDIAGSLLAFAIFFVIFLALREFNCWYFKINDHIKNQKKQIYLSELLLAELWALRTGNKPPKVKSPEGKSTETQKNNLEKCPSCGREEFDGEFCQVCGWTSKK